MTSGEWVMFTGACLALLGFLATALGAERLETLLYVLGLTAVGWGGLLAEISAFTAVLAALCWIYALAMIILDGYRERKRHGKQAVQQGQADGVAPEGEGR